jgi:predicted acyl esterase
MRSILARPFVLAAVAGAVSLAESPSLPPLDLQGVTEEHVWIPMSDGTRLSAYTYRPESEKPLPAVFEQRYASLVGSGTRKAAADLARKGFVVAMVNFRGSQKSEGTYTGYRNLGWGGGEPRDGYDTCEWLARQPWCTGKVGSFGSSQGGFAQNFLAAANPPHLVCQYMVDTGLSLFHEGYRIGGVTRHERFADFGQNCRNPEDNARLLKEWDKHPDFDAYWQEEDCSRHFQRMNVPCFTIGSWYDFMVQGSIQSFNGRQTRGNIGSRGHQQLVIGPWLHGRLNKGTTVNELTYPDNAAWPELDHMARWFDHHLKGKPTGVTDEPPIRYYVMGAVGEPDSPGNVWRTASSWPPSTKSTPLYLQADQKLSFEKPNQRASTTPLPSDPAKPMAIPGRGFPGAKDARPFESQSDVRTWSTEALAEPLEITGTISASLWISTDVPDADFILRVSDVYPDGRSMLLMDYPLRARYRDGFERQILLKANAPTELRWRIGDVSIILNKGHRLRVTVSCSGAPLYEPNPQHGGAQVLGWMKNPRPTTHQILHEAPHPSHIEIPVR